MKKKSKDFMIYFDDNGVAKYYDDTYDITIHCESEEEQRATLERIRSKRWVPCGERLPKDFEDVLVWYEYFRYGEYNRMVQTWDVGYYNSQLNTWGGGVTGQKVRAIAWMPLPEPYKEGAEQIESIED